MYALKFTILQSFVVVLNKSCSVTGCHLQAQYSPSDVLNAGITWNWLYSCFDVFTAES